jgi:hypothetical protein
MPEGDNGETIWSALKPVAAVLGPFKSIAPLERLPNVEPVRGDIRLSEFEQELNGFWAGCHAPFNLPMHGCIGDVDGTRKCPEQSDGSSAITLQPIWIAES